MLMMNDLFNWLGDLLFGTASSWNGHLRRRPKFIASVFRQRYRFVSPILLALLRAWPLIALDRLIVTPWSRLPSPTSRWTNSPAGAGLVELDEIVDAGEQQRLGDV